MIELLYGTPMWVYAALFATLYYGIVAKLPSTNRPLRLMIIPSVLVMLAAYFTVMSSSEIAIASCGFGVGAAAGIVLAGFTYRAAKVGLDIKSGQLTIPGELNLLSVLIVSFGIRYGLGYWSTVDHSAVTSAKYIVINACSSGAVAAYLFGRSLSFLRNAKGLRVKNSREL